jgi:hypothetical protein
MSNAFYLKKPSRIVISSREIEQQQILDHDVTEIIVVRCSNKVTKVYHSVLLNYDNLSIFSSFCLSFLSLT